MFAPSIYQFITTSPSPEDEEVCLMCINRLYLIFGIVITIYILQRFNEFYINV